MIVRPRVPRIAHSQTQFVVQQRQLGNNFPGANNGSKTTAPGANSGSCRGHLKRLARGRAHQGECAATPAGSMVSLVARVPAAFAALDRQ